jgi:hypothetical protein
MFCLLWFDSTKRKFPFSNVIDSSHSFPVHVTCWLSILDWMIVGFKFAIEFLNVPFQNLILLWKDWRKIIFLLIAQQSEYFIDSGSRVNARDPDIGLIISTLPSMISTWVSTLLSRSSVISYLFICIWVQDTSVTWYTDSPDFSLCFQQTVLSWIPCGLLWLMVPLQGYQILYSHSRIKRWTWLSLTRIVSLCVSVIKIIEMK